MNADSYIAPDRDRIALLTVDLQRDTLPGGACETPGTQEILPQVDRALRAFRERGELIVHVVRLYAPDGSNAEGVRRARIEAGETMLAPGSDGAELCKEIQPGLFERLDAPLLLAGGLQELAPNEFALYKPRWGAFYRTDLENLLRACNVSTLVVAGANWPNCPRATVYEASERDFRVVVLADAVSRLDGPGLADLAGIGAFAVETAPFLEWLVGGAPLKSVSHS